MGLVSALALLTLAGGACDSGRSLVRTVEETREFQVAEGDLRWHATSAERFLLQAPRAVAQNATQHWDTPPGWVELPPTSMRTANFQVAGDERAQCYLTMLPGDAGGIAPNINRWRQQMSVPLMTGAEVDALPRWEFFGRDAVLVDIEGTWTGMSGAEQGAGYRLVGLLLIEPSGSKFLKMVGPADVVDAELDAFRELARSFEVTTGSPHGHAPSDDDPPVRSDRGVARLTWEAPQDWRRAPDRTMRAVSFFAGADDAVECYVAVLPGGGGGAQANIDRWCGQMGRDGLSREEFTNLARIPMFDGEGLLVEIEGNFQGMEAEVVSDALLLGVACNLKGAAVFVKMIGPRDAFSNSIIFVPILGTVGNIEVNS